MTTSNAKQPQASTCAATTQAGQPCRARPVTGSDLCFAHDPDLAERRAAARAAGGRHRATVERARRRLPGEVSGMLDVIVTAFHQAAAGDLPPGTAQSLAALAGAYVRLHDVGEHDVALEDLEAQVIELSAAQDRRHLGVVR